MGQAVRACHIGVRLGSQHRGMPCADLQAFAMCQFLWQNTEHARAMNVPVSHVGAAVQGYGGVQSTAPQSVNGITCAGC